MFLIRRQPGVSFCALLMTLLLTACGGGSGGAAVGTAPPPTEPAASGVVAPPSTPSSGVPEPTPDPTTGCTGDDASSVRTNVFLLLNLVRTTVGLSPFVRDTALDTAAQAHARYSATNNHAGQDEQPDRPCFTGATLAERLAGAGVTVPDQANVRVRSEVMLGYDVPANAELPPWDAVNYMLHSLYGRVFLLDARMRDLGVGGSGLPGSAKRTLVLDAALLADTPPTPAATYAFWPRDGATSLPAQMQRSDMKPLEAGVVEGYPASIHAAAPVQVSRFVMTRATDGGAVDATLITAANDRNGVLDSGEAALVPNAPLAAGTTYRVELDATLADQPLHLAWSFTTAP
ncbi:CAP domain-containing protein [Roseateles cellulosilyticus]|uniref:SCP domain-containing protein n=1 Tax=Pelomonas cellulosilytica TaxID=2906762 RepID=A0ABS8XXQ2_9BURK|nr:CAP domain-containing protein [Pelomonas sp. P8]MCE4556053.1 hypothetical protein [Pelomonas sp. P8]